MTLDQQALLRQLGTRLRAARQARDLSVSELARRGGVSRRTVTEAEAGRANLTVTRLHALAVALDLTPGELLDFDPAATRRGRVALVGLRGAGKSTVGRQLALEREAPFVELDQRVEELAGLSLAAIFDLHGAAWFRELQDEALEQVLSEGENLVLAAGGSIVASEATFARLRQTCHTVWLRARPEDHFERVVAQGDNRPMRGRPRALEELRNLLDQREAAYARCELTLETSRRGIGKIVHLLLERFGT